MNRLYPLFLKLEGKPCLVVGGGAVAAEKAHQLCECGGSVAVISPVAGQEIRRLMAEYSLFHHVRGYKRGDAHGNFIVVAATEDREINGLVAADCSAEGILCNVVDVPHLCDFYAASVVRQGDLKIAISTNGKSPALAKKIRRRLEYMFGREYGVFLRFLGMLRPSAMQKFSSRFEERKAFFEEIVKSDALQLLRRGKRKEFLSRMESWFEALREGAPIRPVHSGLTEEE